MSPEGWIAIAAMAVSVLQILRGSLKDYMPRESAELRLKTLEDESKLWRKRWHDYLAPDSMVVRAADFWKRKPPNS